MQLGGDGRKVDRVERFGARGGGRGVQTGRRSEGLQTRRGIYSTDEPTDRIQANHKGIEPLPGARGKSRRERGSL